METKIVTKETINRFLGYLPPGLYTAIFEPRDDISLDNLGAPLFKVCPMTIVSKVNPLSQVRITLKKYATWEAILTKSRLDTDCPVTVNFHLMKEIQQEPDWQQAWKHAQSVFPQCREVRLPQSIYAADNHLWFKFDNYFLTVSLTKGGAFQSSFIASMDSRLREPCISFGQPTWQYKTPSTAEDIKKVYPPPPEPTNEPEWKQAWDKVVDYRGSIGLFTHPDATPDTMYTDGTNYWFKFAPHLYIVLNGCPHTFVAIPNDVNLDDMRPTYAPTGEPAWRLKRDIGCKSSGIRRVKL